MKTKLAILHTLNQPLSIEDVDVPKLNEGQVLVKIKYISICGSQLNEIYGRNGPDKYLPHALGHEGFGTVVEKHKSVLKVEEGDDIILTWLKCRGLKAESAQYGKFNAGPIHTFGEYVVISENHLIKIKNVLFPKLAPLLGCSIPTGIGVINNLIKSHKKTLAVVGLGMVGLSSLIWAKYSEIFSDLYGYDIDCQRNNILDKLNIKKWVVEPADYIVNTTPNLKSMEDCFKKLSTTGTLIIVGNPRKFEPNISINVYDLIFGKVVIGSCGGDLQNPDIQIPEFARKLDLFDIGKKYFTEYPLDDINVALEDFEHQKVLKPIIYMS